MSDPILFNLPESTAPDLEVARRNLERCELELREAEALLAEQGAEAKPRFDACYFAQRRAARVVAHLEAEEIKGMRNDNAELCDAAPPASSKAEKPCPGRRS